MILVAWGPAMRSAAISHTSSHQPIVPSYIWQNVLTTFRCSGNVLTTFRCQRTRQQLNTLQTVVRFSDPHAWIEKSRTCLEFERKIMVKPHGSLVPVSLTPRGASTSGLSTWSSTRSLLESCDSRDLISWRVSRLDAFSVSPFRT